MNTFPQEWWVAHPLVESLGWTLVHTTWQGLLIGGTAALLLASLRGASASLRYGIACSGMCGLALAAVGTATFCLSSGDRQASRTDRQTRSGEPDSVRPVDPQLFRPSGSDTGSSAWQPVPEAGVVSSPEGSRGSVIEPATIAGKIERTFPAVVALWCGGVAFLSLRLVAGLWRVRQWKRLGTPVGDPQLLEMANRLAARMGLRGNFRLLESVPAVVPFVIGWLRPVVIVPTSLSSGWSPAELESLLAHELAHIRRQDWLVNLLQSVVETVFFYHPVVWWLSRVIRTERENCCDDLALETCGNRVALARALVRMEAIRSGGTGLALSASDGSLLARIRRVAAVPDATPTTWWPAGFVVLASLALMAGGMWVSARASQPVDPDRDSPQEPSASSGDTSSSRGDGVVDRPGRQWEIHRPEVETTDPRTGQKHSVLAGVRLEGRGGRSLQLDMKYSNLMNYSFVPASVAESLGAVDLGEIDFGERPVPAGSQPQFQLPAGILFPAPPVPENATRQSSPTEVPQARFVDAATGDGPIVPYPSDAIWIPDHLALYGINANGQRTFRVVRIERVDLGLGPPLGPVHALVLDDRNTALGVLGSDWARQLKGERGEGFVHSASSGFYFMAFENGAPENGDGAPTAGSPPVPDQSPERDPVDRIQDPETPAPDSPVRVHTTHSYATSRRESTGWIDIHGTQVPVDAGVEHDGVRVHLSLMFDVVAVDTATGKLLWHRDWNKSEPVWKTVSIVDLRQPTGILTAVELLAGQSRCCLDLRTGKEIGTPVPQAEVSPVAVAPAEDSPAVVPPPDDPLPELKVVQRENGRVQRAVLASRPSDRTASGLLDQFRQSQRRPGAVELGGWVTSMETLVSASQPNLLPITPPALTGGFDAAEVDFFLPGGSGVRAEFSGESIQIRGSGDSTQITVTRGRLQLIDDGGVIRADASPDGGAELLVVECRRMGSEYGLKMRAARIAADPEYPDPPVQVKLNLAVGAPADEIDPPHGSVRFGLDSSAAGGVSGPLRLKMKWHYDLGRLVEEAAAASRPGGQVLTVPAVETVPAPQDPVEREGWGEPAPESGIRFRLTLMTEKPQVGQPLLFKLETGNFGDQPAGFDPQKWFPFRVLKAADAAGKPARFIGPTPQTEGQVETLMPGEIRTLWENADAAALFLLDGETWRFTAESSPGREGERWPNSNTVEVRLAAGELPPQQVFLKQLGETVPDGWTISGSFGAVYLVHSPTGLKADVTTIQIWFSEEELPADFELGKGEERQIIHRLGRCEAGFMNVGFPRRAERLWPGCAAAIHAVARQAFEFPPDPQAENEKPWRVTGRVTDAAGQPLSGARVWAHTGIGSLKANPPVVTDAAGRYDLRFGPGFRSDDRGLIQAATISVQLDGHFEQNLHRHGARMAALEEPSGDRESDGNPVDGLFLPGQSREIDFVMLPAARLRGVVIDEKGDRLDGVRKSLVGPDLPPSSSVAAEGRSDKGGRFELADLPTDFAFQILVQPARAASPWPGWASPPLSFHRDPQNGGTCLRYRDGERDMEMTVPELTLVLRGDGVAWKEAVARAAGLDCRFRYDGIADSEGTRIRAGMANLELGGRD